MSTLQHLQTIQDVINEFNKTTGFVLTICFKNNQLVIIGSEFEYISTSIEDAESFAWGLLNGAKIKG